MWKLGTPVLDKNVISALSTTDLISKHSPCSGNIWVVSPVVTGEIYLGVTYRAFTDHSITWYKLTSYIKAVGLFYHISHSLPKIFRNISGYIEIQHMFNNALHYQRVSGILLILLSISILP